MDDRKSTKSVEQSVKEAEQLVANSVDLESLEGLFKQGGRGHAISASYHSIIP